MARAKKAVFCTVRHAAAGQRLNGQTVHVIGRGSDRNIVHAILVSGDGRGRSVFVPRRSLKNCKRIRL